ncbi:MAG: hypothetical protein SOU51_01145 [Collinsella sp.]|nr:hypothetical protein [Collinsella sp.]
MAGTRTHLLNIYEEGSPERPFTVEQEGLSPADAIARLLKEAPDGHPTAARIEAVPELGGYHVDCRRGESPYGDEWTMRITAPDGTTHFEIGIPLPHLNRAPTVTFEPFDVLLARLREGGGALDIAGPEVDRLMAHLKDGKDLYDPKEGIYFDSYLNEDDPRLVIANVPVQDFAAAADDPTADGILIPHDVALGRGTETIRDEAEMRLMVTRSARRLVDASRPPGSLNGFVDASRAASALRHRLDDRYSIELQVGERVVGIIVLADYALDAERSVMEALEDDGLTLTAVTDGLPSPMEPIVPVRVRPAISSDLGTKRDVTVEVASDLNPGFAEAVYRARFDADPDGSLTEKKVEGLTFAEWLNAERNARAPESLDRGSVGTAALRERASSSARALAEIAPPPHRTAIRRS